MTRLILHIGHPKTGTSSLQFALAGNYSQLLKSGVLYPRMGNEHKHALLMPHLMDGRVNPAVRRRTRMSDEEIVAFSRKNWATLKATARDNRPDVIVLSAEGFWVPGEVEAAMSARRILGDIASEIQIVAYLRSPPSLFLSRLNQKVRMMHELPQVLCNYYRSAINCYMEAGFDKIHLRPFDSSEMVNGDIVDDFCKSFLPEFQSTLNRDVIGRTNESISTEAMAVLWEIWSTRLTSGGGQKQTRRGKMVREIRALDASLPGATRPKLHPWIREAIIASSTDLDWLRAEKGFVFPDIDYDSIGQKPIRTLETLGDISSLCPTNLERLKDLRAQAEHRFAVLGL